MSSLKLTPVDGDMLLHCLRRLRFITWNRYRIFTRCSSFTDRKVNGLFSRRETVITCKQAFQADAAGADKEYVKFSGHVMKFYGALSDHKCLQWLRTGKRVLLITNAALYNLKGEHFNCHRRLPLSKVTSIIRSYLRHQFVIKIKREKARRYLSEKVCEICDSIRSAQAIKCRASCPIKYQKKQDSQNFVVRMAQHTLNLMNSKENEAEMKRAIDDAAVRSERIETLDAEVVISEYIRRAHAKPYGS